MPAECTTVFKQRAPSRDPPGGPASPLTLVGGWGPPEEQRRPLEIHKSEATGLRNELDHEEGNVGRALMSAAPLRLGTARLKPSTSRGFTGTSEKANSQRTLRLNHP